MSNPKVEHGDAVKWLGRYLQGTKDMGIILKHEGKSFDVYVDTDFSGNWNKKEAREDKSTAHSRYGYFIRYMGCPILWASKLNNKIALHSTVIQFIGLSHALHTTIP
jgi:hypothetical protein